MRKRKQSQNFAKEVIIMLLLAIIILLIMMVGLYEFMPSNIVIPETVTYSSDATTTSIKQEINYTNGGDITADGDINSVSASLRSYSIETSDLTVYGQKNLYNSGNSNPFEYVQDEPTQEGGEGSTSTQSTTGGTPAQTTASQTTPAQQIPNTSNPNTQTSTGTVFESKTSK